MSNINTNNINTNYPVPGVNNSTQPFRDNFSSIKNNLDTAYNEITDLQNKAVVKSALAGTTVNNDMANTLISNALTRTFRASTYNLGSSLTGIVNINVTLGDVQYGTVTANTQLQLTNWAPAGTQGNVQLSLTFGNANAYVTFPNTVIVTNNNYGGTIVENYSLSGGNLTITPPNGVTRLDYMLSTLDCGNTVTITPINRPQQSTQIQQRTPVNIGAVGDRPGAICVDNNYVYVCTGVYDGATAIWKRSPLTAY